MLSGAVAETFALMIEIIRSVILLSHLLTKGFIRLSKLVESWPQPNQNCIRNASTIILSNPKKIDLVKFGLDCFPQNGFSPMTSKPAGSLTQRLCKA